MVVALAISIPLGIIAAVNQNSIKDTIAMVLALLGLSMPNFWLGLLLIMLFSLKLGWLPSGGYENGMLSLILPAFTIGAGLAAFMTRSTRSSMLDVIRQDVAPYVGKPDSLDVAIRMNADKQVERITSYPHIRSLIDKGELAVVRAYYNVHTGKVDF